MASSMAAWKSRYDSEAPATDSTWLWSPVSLNSLRYCFSAATAFWARW